ncbi:GTP cyclohydrolase I [Halobacteroides halobius DSM 5150]|uniref:GTP cyclohydrolase 1 n=1 Tax=Halobacteroides halobius (strain ATCC 35273 / DSM 5150 / MD-1) TaxID=748449 RepID=L0K628_HALHC|nr:GTP cyclohydrolase I FolE [Halobacteroides halobius]AGB40471.1 GTP cyclohydrolase I [Halobacteroides halobius DSM 5150]
MDQDRIEKSISNILEAIGEDPQREGLEKTPKRVAKMYQEIFLGVNKEPSEALDVFVEDEANDLVLVRDITFYSLCEHHLIPFFGKVHLAYKPQGGRVTGFSKLTKLVETVAKRPQLQERMTKIIADTMMEILEPQGVYVIVEAQQLCMTMRGVEQTETETITSASRGIFKEDSGAKNEVINLIYRGRTR